MTGFVLLFAVACLGGVIATVGDRIGMKVGKSRLSLFNLRPRQTATLVSVATGMVASFSTLMLLIALDDQLRKGLFQLDDIQQELSQAQSDLEATRTEKESVETNLAESILLQEEARSRLRDTNRSLRTAAAREEEILASLSDTQEQLDTVSTQADELSGEIDGLRAERQALIEEREQVRAQIAQRDQDIAQRNEQLSEQSQTLRARDEELRDRNQQIAQRDEDIAAREARLEDLQARQRFLDQQITRLEDDFDNLRLGTLAIPRNANLVVTLTSPNSEDDARRVIENALLEANRIALRAIWPGLEEINDFALFFEPETVTQLLQNTFDGRDYAIIVSTAANYVVGEPCVGEILNQGGEPCVLVRVEAVENEVIYVPGSSVASVQVERDDLSTENLRERFGALVVRAELQARRDGIINASPVVARRRADVVFAFLNQIEAYGEPLEIQAIASQPGYTLGPVSLELAAVQNGQVLFTTFPAPVPSAEE